MPILDQTNPKEVAAYQAFIESSPYARATQDMAWARVKANWVPEYVYLTENGGTCEEEPITAALSMLGIRAVQNKTLLYACRGPVADFYDVETCCRLIEESMPLFEKHEAFVLRIDPEVPWDGELVEAYRRKGFTFRSRETGIHDFIQPRFDMILPIGGMTEEEVLNSVSSKCRYNIRLAHRKGVTTRWSREAEDLAVYELTKIMAERQGITYRPISYFENLLEAYPEVRIYLSSHEDEILSAAIAFPYGEQMWYMYGASSNVKRNYMPNYDMQWEMIKWGIELGKTRYNLGGVYAFTPEDGIFHFKNGFCQHVGPTEWIGELDVVLDESAYQEYVSR